MSVNVYKGSSEGLINVGGGSSGAFVGTLEEWNDLPVADKAKYDGKEVIITDDYSEGNTLDIYSIDEIVVGRWIDGKPIYRRVIEINWADMTATTDYSHYLDISEWNVDFPVSVNMTLYQEPIKWIAQNGSMADTNYYRYITFTDAAINIVLGTIDKTRTPKFIVIVEYTKK